MAFSSQTLTVCNTYITIVNYIEVLNDSVIAKVKIH